MKITAVVVTYNRKDMLVECIDAILGQSYPVDEVVVLDNASTDGTRQLLEEKSLLQDRRVAYVRKEENTGGAGGFYYGSKRAYEDGADWIWMMDDDCIPTPTALEELMKAGEIVDCGFLSSVQFHEDGSPSGSPGVDIGKPWYDHLSEGIVQITYASFVSFFVKREAVEKCGLPYPNYFIYGDDAEYSLRLNRCYKPGYYVGKSIVIHKTEIKASYWDETNPNVIHRLHYLVRNSLLNSREYSSLKGRIKCRINFARLAFSIVFSKRKKKLQKLWQIVQGFAEYHLGTYDREAFRNRFTNHLENNQN